jgi:hypothetical protein
MPDGSPTPPSEFATKLDISKKIGVSRPTIDKYLAMEGAPKPNEDMRYNLLAVLDWIRECGAKSVPTNAVADARQKKLLLECDKLTIAIDQGRHALAVQRGEYISKAEASETLAPLMSELKSMLQQVFEVELPSQYRGKTAVEQAELNAAGVDRVIQRIREGTARLRVE